MAMEYEKLTGRQKSAILMVALGTEASAQIFKELDDQEMERISVEIANLGVIPAKVKDMVVEEFQQMVLAREYIIQGGLDYAREILEEALGPSRALDIISRVQSSIHQGGFELLKNVDPNQLLNFLRNEQPQTIALIMAHLHPAQASNILIDLPEELQGDVIARLATLEQTPPEVIREIESVLETQISTVFTEDFTQAGGIEAAADIINRVGRSTEKSVLEWIQRENPDLAAEIKNLMFTFEDIIILTDKAIQMIIKEVDSNDLALALKNSTDPVREKIFRNMSERAANMLREDLEYMGPVRLREVEEAQQRIVAVIRRLEENEVITISRGGAEDQLIE